MKLRWKIAVGLAAAGALCALLMLRSDRGAQKGVEETRRTLRQQGFKTDLSEFNFSTSPEMCARAAALTNATMFKTPYGRYELRISTLQSVFPGLPQTVGSDSAFPVWQNSICTTDPGTYFRLTGGGSGDDLWPALREELNESRMELDAACVAALSGPIGFDLNASNGNAMLLPHVASLKNLAQTFSSRAVLELHDGNKDAAWTNLLASTRLVTAWDPEPVETSHLVRFACAIIAFNTTWQTLQAGGWADERLANLQGEWASADFFQGLPETAAFMRASMVATCQRERQQPMSGLGITLREGIHYPRNAWYQLSSYLRQLRYRHYGTYEDEKNLLLFYRDRELELRQAVQAPTWSEMRQHPGITNVVLFRSRYPSRMQSLLNMRQLALAAQMYASSASQQSSERGRTLMARATETEARRRLIVTAIALERYRGRHGAYPKTLQELVPELLKNPPVDFMDGKPLRYRLTDDGRFVLYSVGLDCIDDGGTMPRPGPQRASYPGAPGSGIPQRTDLVWPRPASEAEVSTYRQEQINALRDSVDQSEEIQAEAQWRHTAKRQAAVEKILASKPNALSSEPTYRGRRLSEVLRNESTPSTNRLGLDELLTLRQVITGEEPETVTFEAPIAYDVLTNLASLELLVDPVADEDSDEGCAAGMAECERATNGNCLLVWHTIYECPGKHALQLGLELDEPTKPDEDIRGPMVPFVVSNLCQFSLSSAHFNPTIGGTLRAKLPESNGTYTVEIKLPRGDTVRTITGSTTNGILKVFWDVLDDHGNRCTNHAFDTVFHITLPDSGRSWTMKGP
jgi:hypothetical protein